MNLRTSNNLVVAIITISFSLLGLSFILGANPNAIGSIFSFYKLDAQVPAHIMSMLAGFAFCFVGITSLHSHLGFLNRALPTITAFAISMLCLITLFGANRWLASEGGFPVIGSGQGIIKYFAVIPLFLFVFYKDALSDKAHIALNYASVALVLVWIGAMKFFAFEANAIVSLVESSPFMSWLYIVFSVQGASNAIGIFDILSVALLGVGLFIRNAKLILLAGLACCSVFIMTQTFLITAPNALSSVTVFERLGQFVIKDLWFIANLVIIYHLAVFNNTPKETAE
ncbi:DUF417 family protein [Pseudoalteromonas sp. UCD-33C]|mgnify:FL=1|uniref:DUF417 family protein n=1 Tax=Pseudoalteromonas sp. UCD-33C TaxID=1716175 RepID=UPI0006CA5B02|nr:DUF417 family protein [Pseudoalteromonas sp. UCD-33C]KPM77560.1 hypothetical protein AOG26_11515 [Pseudoalteromonas sp. UCD-33C]